MALLAFQWPGCLLQQHPPARRNSPLLERESFDSWQLVSCLAGSGVVSAGRSHAVGVSSEVPRGLAWRGRLWLAGLGRNAVGQCLAAAKQPGATGDTGEGLDVGLGGGAGALCPALSCAIIPFSCARTEFT